MSSESLTKSESEYAGIFGRVIVRFDRHFHSLVWTDPMGGLCAKLYRASDAGCKTLVVADALKCVHNNISPPPGSRSVRRVTWRGRPAVAP